MAENKGDSSETRIRVKVLGIENNVIQYKIKIHCPFRNLMNKYCTNSGLDEATTKFKIDGYPISGTSTPKSMGIMDNDVIVVFQHQLGGGLY